MQILLCDRLTDCLYRNTYIRIEIKISQMKFNTRGNDYNNINSNKTTKSLRNTTKYLI